jgi:hypothetical protein
MFKLEMHFIYSNGGITLEAIQSVLEGHKKMKHSSKKAYLEPHRIKR